MQIVHLHLFCPDVEAQATFYGDVLGLSVHRQGAETLLIDVGATTLQFSHRENAAPVHFAFNIPSNQIHSALAWLKERTEVIATGDKFIHHFENWDAEAVYFHDPNGNIVELIARKRLGLDMAGPFSVEHFLSVSEIGLGAKETMPVYQELLDAGVPVHSGGPERFCSLGTPSGLFILVNTDRKATWFPTGAPIQSCEWAVRIELHGKSLGFEWEAHTLKTIVQP